MRRIEARIVRRAAHVMFASERDRLLIMGAATTPEASIVPNGVDLAFWRRTALTLGRDRIVFTGAMHYPPNVDAALVLANQVLPLVRRRLPEVSLDIVGRDPAPALLAIADRPGVRVTGYVPDVRPYLDGASVFAAPLRFGAGIQNKLLEALAMEVPVVASTLAIDGLRVGREAPPAAVADDPSTHGRPDRRRRRGGATGPRGSARWSRSRVCPGVVPLGGERAAAGRHPAVGRGEQARGRG